MDLLQILDNYEKLEHLDFTVTNKLRLTDRITVLPWKRNYWSEKPLQDQPYHKRLRRLRSIRKTKCSRKIKGDQQ